LINTYEKIVEIICEIKAFKTYCIDDERIEFHRYLESNETDLSMLDKFPKNIFKI
jgi:hypothetical protein